MRRFVLLLMIALLPLQSIWAAANGCVAGAAAAAGGHLGQHEHGGGHDHAAPANATDDGGPASGVAAGGEDCSPAHGHCCLGIVANGDVTPSHQGGSTYLAVYLRVVPDAFPESPLRPPRATLA